jgi:hypothetical protein
MNFNALIDQKRWSHVIVTWKGFNELREQQLFSFDLLNNDCHRMNIVRTNPSTRS